MFGPIVRHRSVIVALVLATIGFILIIVSHAFQMEWGKIQIDRLVAETGTLFLIVGILHWLFEIGLRREMLREIAGTITGNTGLHDCGLDSCLLDSRQVDEKAHWSKSANLTIGNQYSARFFKDFHDALKQRCTRGLPTTVTILRPASAAAQYVQSSLSANPAVIDSIAESVKLLGEIGAETKKGIRILFHDQVLRYSFIQTDEYVWIKFFTNSSGRATVPAFKVRSNTPLFEFFAADIKRLLERARESY
jgi:hypothetical protein